MAERGLSELEPDERIRIDREPLNGMTFTVSDVEEESIGLTTVVVVSLVCGCDGYVLKGASHSDTCELANKDEEFEVELTDITFVGG